MAFHLYDYPQPAFVNTLLHIIDFGACIDFQGEEHAQFGLDLKPAFELPIAIQADIDAQVANGWTHGPFLMAPFLNFRSSPLGTIAKKHTSKQRRIHHLS